ncbi:hypothetical protein JCM10450v2_006453 [Rhodotorula kratochvilovae]
MQTRAARKAARLPLRLPDELVLMIIETCDRLNETDREKTLAALCCLAKRYKGAAERLAEFSNLKHLSIVEEVVNTEELADADIPSSSKEILDAIPSNIQHLSLVTSFFAADDIAAFLLGADRPPGLRTLRLGGGVGQGFKEFARTKKAWYAAFEWKMEKAGIELPTVG